MRPIDLTGKRFGRWFVISRAENNSSGRACWLCRCICGTERVLAGILLRNGHSQSCGCFKREQIIVRSTKHGHNPANGPTSATYYSWASMINRCTNPRNKSFPRYGGRGIIVCERWFDFRNFLADMGEKPNGRLSLDRIDNNGNYERDNCRWATRKEQARNTRRNRTLNGQTKSITEWAEIYKLPRWIIYDRLRLKWSIEKVLTTPVRR
jgi:hypothetical protein